MARASVSGLGVVVWAAGGYVMYAAVRDVPLLEGARQLLKGQTPTARPKPGTGGDAPGWLNAISKDPLGGVNGSLGASAGTALGPDAAAAGGAQLADAAKHYLGRPYALGGTFAGGAGGDCSGLVYRSFHDIGKNTPRLIANAYPVWNQVQKVTRANVSAGDLLWYPGHIAIAVSGSQMIEAPTFGVPVRITGIRGNPMPLRYVGGW